MLAGLQGHTTALITLLSASIPSSPPDSHIQFKRAEMTPHGVSFPLDDVRQIVEIFVRLPLDRQGPSCIIELVQVRQRSSVSFSLEPAVQIHISANDGVAIYLQIVNQIKYLVASGRLTPGEELPPIRVLAQRLLINPNTVARAYRELESAGIVEKRRTAGTYVSDQGSPLARRERVKILTLRIDALLAEARQMDVVLAEVLKLIEQRHSAMQTTRSEE
jgi:GntR family transcriptional regulator